MITISICMIIKNEEVVLDRCLSSIQEIADEIIIVDTGSSDQSKAIASKYTNKVYDFEWCDDFSKARNYSFSKAHCDYCMWIDADDILLEKDKNDLIHLKETLSKDVSIVMMRYNTAFDKKGKPTFTYYRERLIRRSDHFEWQGFIHEAITPREKIEYSEIAITHQKEKVNDPLRNVTIYEKKRAEGYPFTPRDTFYYARELYYQHDYDRSIQQFQQFLKSKQGWIENNIAACQFLAYCYFELKQFETSLDCLFHSFLYDEPRAELCCDLGKCFYELSRYRLSIYWYERALACPRKDDTGAFIQVDCYEYIPYIQLCLCYDAIHDYQKAFAYNELAGKCKPDDPSYLHNKDYFKNIHNFS